MKTLTLIDVCEMIEARGGCDLREAPYRVPDTLSPAMRVQILTAMARAGARSPEVCRATDQALLRYLPKFPGAENDAEAVSNALLAFIQKDVGYVDDPEGEYYQGPIYTLEHGGDCEDLSVLFVSMADCAGVESRVAWMEQPKARLNHVTAQVLLSEKGWSWAETTIASATVGMHPYEAAKRYGNARRIHG